MTKLAKAQANVPKFLSTHPQNQDRQERLREHMEEVVSLFPFFWGYEIVWFGVVELLRVKPISVGVMTRFTGVFQSSLLFVVISYYPSSLSELSFHDLQLSPSGYEMPGVSIHCITLYRQE